MSAALEAIVAAHVAAATSGFRHEIAHLHEAFAELSAQHVDLRDRHERMFRPGVVTDYDASKHLYRQQIGIDENGQPVKSPWRPYTQHAGALSHHVPLSAGQQMLMISPDGDLEQGIGVPYGWSNANPAPSSDAKTISGKAFGVSWTVNNGVVTLTGALTVKGDVKASSGVFQHNSKDVGSTHKHGGVQAGADNTDVPA
jgi:phage baseplate assembly protein gpV